MKHVTTILASIDVEVVCTIEREYDDKGELLRVVYAYASKPTDRRRYAGVLITCADGLEILVDARPRKTRVATTKVKP